MRKSTGVMTALAVVLSTSLAVAVPLGAVAGPGVAPRTQSGDDDATPAPGAKPGQVYIDQLTELNEELESLDADIASARARQTELRRATGRIDDEAEATDDAIEDAETQIATLEAILRDRLAGTYMAEGTELGGLDPTVDKGVIRRIYAEARTETDERLARRLDAQRDRLDREKDELADLEDELDDQQTELEATVAELEDQQEERVAKAAELQVAIEEAQRQALIEAAEKARLAAVAAEQARLAQVAAAEAAAQDKADLEAFLEAAREAQEAAAAAALEAGQAGVGTPAFAPGGIDLCTVADITVNCLIAEPLGNMVLAAAADGVTLTGYGYRSTQQQIALRIANCGGDVYGRPASACSPPTARPGSSLHEVGLAIDFDRCSTRSTPCWIWLDEHAEAFGFRNLPSEPWHWSTSGG